MNEIKSVHLDESFVVGNITYRVVLNSYGQYCLSDLDVSVGNCNLWHYDFYTDVFEWLKNHNLRLIIPKEEESNDEAKHIEAN